MPRFARLAFPALAALALVGCDKGGDARPPAPPPGPELASHAASALPSAPSSVPGTIAAARETDRPDANGCGADKLGRWLNSLPTADVKAEIARAVGERPVRYYTQGDPVTTDYSPARLNVELGKDGRIKLFRCG
jgi:hypothetical protein